MRPTHTFVLLVAISISLGSSCVHAAQAFGKAGSPVNRAEVRTQVDADAPLVDQLESLYSLARTDQKQADEDLQRMLADPRFATQGASLKHDAYALSTWLELEAGDYHRALKSARLRVAADPDVMADWYPLAMLEHHYGDKEAGARALSHLIRTWPEQARDIDVVMVTQLIHQSKLQPDARLDLLQALTQANWMEGRSANSSLWYELTLMQLLKGNIEQAREAAQRVATAEFIVNLRSDRQFDRLIDRTSPRFDVGLAARNEVETLQRLASASPDSLELRNELNDAMLMSGMTLAALTHADLILAKMDQMSSDDHQFTDMDARVWTMNNRAVALRRLGRVDESLRELEAASRLEENGHPNVSQILNLAQSYCSMAKPQKARETLARLGDSLSPYGHMVKASSEHRIAVQMRDVGAARKALDYLRENRDFSQSLYLWALLETDQLDQAAELVKGLLASPANRTEALAWAQESLEAPEQPGDVVAEANLKALLARPDVKTAITTVGHVERYPIFIGYMND